MAKITRQLMKIFGQDSGINEVGVFGSLAAGSIAYATTPEQAQSLTNWTGGWFDAVVGGNSPAIEDLNAASFVFGYQLSYLMQEGIAEWNADTTYYIGSVVNSGGVIYVSLTDTNLNNAVTDSTKWTSIDGKIVTSAATHSVSAGQKLISVSATHTETLPDAATVLGQAFEFVKTDSNASTVTIAFTGGQTCSGAATLSLIEQYSFYVIRSVGTGWLIVGAG